MNLTDNEIETLKTCKSEEQWNAACDAIKKARSGAYPPDWWARSGAYPPDWWPRVKLSGLMDRILASFGSDSEIRIETFRK